MARLEPKVREDHVGAIVSFLRHALRDSGRKGFVLGMSGGVDSSVVAALCARAVGPAKVLGLGLPDRGTPARDRRDAREWAQRLGIGFREVDISPAVQALARELGVTRRDRIRLGNVKARARMVTLYDVAAAERRVVVGTGNKSELALGYFTRWGDGGADFLPIGDLYKTQVRGMAEILGVPRRIREKTPSAGLWPGQTDEGELGIAYDELDRILLGIELQLDSGDIARRVRVSLAKVRRIEDLVARNAYKRRIPLIPKLGIRTFGLDWRE